MRSSWAAMRLSPLPTTAQWRRGGARRAAAPAMSSRRASTASMASGSERSPARRSLVSRSSPTPSSRPRAQARRNPAATWA